MTWFLQEETTIAPPERPGLLANIPNWTETFAARFKASRLPSRVSGMAWGQGELADYLDGVEKDAGITAGVPPGMSGQNPRGSSGMNPNDWRRARYLSTVQAARAKDPQAYPGLPAAPEEFDAEYGRWVRAKQDELNATLAAQPQSMWGAQTLGGLVEFISRPSSVVTAPLSAFAGPELGLGKMFAGQAAIGGGQSALDVSEQNATARVTGDREMTWGESIAATAEGAVVNGALGVGLHLLPRAVKGLIGAARSPEQRAVAYSAVRDTLTGQRRPEGITPGQGKAAVDAASARLNDDAPTIVAPKGDSTALPELTADAPPDWERIRNGIFAGESGADYNALFGYQNRPGGKFSDVRLTDMTVDEALAFADPSGPYGQWVNGEIGRVATPMGAYQIVGTTLRAAKKGLGLTGDEVMTPELQERLAQWIYREQGTNAWEGYRGPRETFTPTTGGDAPTYRGTARGQTGDAQVTTGKGDKIDVKYVVVDLDSLRGAKGDLQPRDRSRITSDAWISQAAAKLDPTLLMPDPKAGSGTPIIGADSIIESGNGRVAAIARAYDLHPENAAAYRAKIEAEGFTIPAGVRRPVLVAERQTPMTPVQRRQFTIDAQDDGIAVMNPTDIARATSQAMTSPVLARLDPAQPLGSEANSAFVRAALQGLGDAQRNAMFDATGKLNMHGARQLREALFARAWPDADILARYAETDAGELRSLIDALEISAPQFAALKSDIAAGLVKPEADISGHVLDAMRTIATARDVAAREAIPVEAALRDLISQPDFEHGIIAPLTEALVGKFWKNGRAAPAKEIGGFLARYADDARKVMRVGDALPVSPKDILARIDPESFASLPDDLGQPRLAASRPEASDFIRTDYPATAYHDGAVSAETAATDDVLSDHLGLPADAPEPPAAQTDAPGEVTAAQPALPEGDWPDLLIRTEEKGGVELRDVVADISEQTKVADVLASCFPKGL